jgi:hypothetical protein
MTPITDSIAHAGYEAMSYIGRMTDLARQFEKEAQERERYIARLIRAGHAMADVTTEHRRRLWMEAVNAKEDNQ